MCVKVSKANNPSDVATGKKKQDVERTGSVRCVLWQEKTEGRVVLSAEKLCSVGVWKQVCVHGQRGL